VNTKTVDRLPPKILLLIVLVISQFLFDAYKVRALARDTVGNKAAVVSTSLIATDDSPRKIAIGLYINNQSKLDSLYIWGEEWNAQAIDFPNWLIPLDKLTQATGWQTKIIGDQVEISAGNQVIRVPLLQAPATSGLGAAISVKDLGKLPGLQIKFDAQKYAIDLTIPTQSPSPAPSLIANATTQPAVVAPAKIVAPIAQASPVASASPAPSNNSGLLSSGGVSPAAPPQAQVVPQIPPPIRTQFTPSRLLVGLNINSRPKLEGFYVWGQENGAEAVNFDDWLLPFDELAQSLGWKIKEIASELEISTSSQRFRIPLNKVIIDRNLGRAIAARDIAAIPGYAIKFDIYKYAIDITVPGAVGSKFTALEPPIVLEGLESVRPPSLGVSIIQQRLNSSGSASGDFNEPQGELQAAGHLGDAGWYLRFNQPTISQTSNWNLSEATVVRQNRSDDQILGTQSPFWRSRNGGAGNYWGATAVYRNGFEAPTRFSGGSYSLNERLQARRSSRVISGTAEPGTLVQLVKNDRTQLLQEVLVDSSGTYRFDNVVVSGNLDDTFIGREYQVLLYPRGQLTANPTVRDISFTTFSGQIPVGADAFVISAGANRISSGNFGNFDGIQGGVLYRRGLTDALTAGFGVAYDREVRGVGEFFWQPDKALEIAANATTGSDAWDYAGRLSYRPSQDFYISGNVDRFNSNANTYWRLGRNFAALGSYDSTRGPTIGAEYFDSGPNRSTRLQADVDLQGRTRINASQRWDEFQASYLGNESADALQLSYTPASAGIYSNSGHEFVLGYQASRQVANSSLASALWRYRSPEKSGDGRNLWQTELGYGFNGSGSGALANADLNIFPGLQLRASYRGISDTSSQGSYAIELTTTLFTGNGIRGTFDRIEDFRNLGKVVFQPFYDKNQNGRQDAGEEGYWDPLLIRLNEKPIDRFRPQVTNNQGDLNLPNGEYRIDIDPAGYPVNFRSRLEALRLAIVSGGVTTVSIPLIQSYSMVGFVKDTKGDVIPGGRVEALNLRTKTKVISITNDSGFYTLEGLEQDEYQITVSGLTTAPNSIKVTPNSPPQQEINLVVTIPQ
jgi:Carboxypeptidase regulatory-like domain